MLQNHAKTTGCKVDLSGILPARMTAELTAKILGFQEHDIPVLVNLGQLEPLGKPPKPNCVKYFARVQILEISENLSWLSKATKTLYQHWNVKNANRKSNEPETESSRAE